MSEIHAAFAANGSHQLNRLDELLTLLMPASQRDKPPGEELPPPLGSGLTSGEYDRAQKLLWALASPEASRRLHEADNPAAAPQQAQQQTPQPGETPPAPAEPEPIGPPTPEDEDEDEPQPAAERTTTITRTTTTTTRRK
jgi:hypothetical protein